MEKQEICNKGVAFTGHRDILRSKRSDLKQKLSFCVRNLYYKGMSDFYCGAAWGFDLLAAEVVLSLKSELPTIRLICVIPYRGQSENWSLVEQTRYKRVISKADKVVILSENYFGGCFFRRNDYLVNHSCGIVAYYDGKPKGGTFYTVKKAQANSLWVINLYH
jgi:uncharacterized phage-like protein YoqJ